MRQSAPAREVTDAWVLERGLPLTKRRDVREWVIRVCLVIPPYVRSTPICGTAPEAGAFKRWRNGNGAVICSAYWRGQRPLASMKSATLVTDQQLAL